MRLEPSQKNLYQVIGSMAVLRYLPEMISYPVDILVPKVYQMALLLSSGPVDNALLLVDFAGGREACSYCCVYCITARVADSPHW